MPGPGKGNKVSDKVAKSSQRWLYGSAILVFLIYCAWILGPYFRSVLVRDASISSWIHVETSPIDGQIVSELPEIGPPIGEDGGIIEIRNDRLFRETQTIVELRNRLEHASARIADLNALLERLREIERERTARIQKYAAIFRAEIEKTIETLQRERAFSAQRIRKIEQASKQEGEADGATAGSAGEVQSDALELNELRRTLLEIESRLEYTLVRRDAAAQAVYLDEDGSDPGWAQVADFDLELLIARSRLELGEAEAARRESATALVAEEAELERLRHAEISIQAGAVVESIEVGEHATVSAGDPLLSWVDCSVLLVDAPVSDAELPLIRPGMNAEVVLEGEAEKRIGTVLLTRGSTATLDHRALASVAKGRTERLAQVIVELGAIEWPADECPVGRAAYVGFPDVGLIDVIRARLRL